MNFICLSAPAKSVQFCVQKLRGIFRPTKFLRIDERKQGKQALLGRTASSILCKLIFVSAAFLMKAEFSLVFSRLVRYNNPSGSGSGVSVAASPGFSKCRLPDCHKTDKRDSFSGSPNSTLCFRLEFVRTV